MSNTKWRLVFDILARPELGVRQIVAKFTGLDDEKPMDTPWHHGPHEYLDSVAFGPFPIAGLEWVEIRENASAVRSALEGTGKQFRLEDTGQGLRIIGHVSR